jgi:hypothetical protein
VADRRELRVSDQDRDRAAQALREHFAAGRLSAEDLNARIEAVYEARTLGDLDAVGGDLPVLAAEQRADVSARRAQLQGRLLHQTGAALVPFLVCVAIWLATGANGMFWPIWVALAAAIPLVRNAWELYGPAPDLDRVERELDRHRNRAERGRRHR